MTNNYLKRHHHILETLEDDFYIAISNENYHDQVASPCHTNGNKVQFLYHSKWDAYRSFTTKHTHKVVRCKIILEEVEDLGQEVLIEGDLTVPSTPGHPTIVNTEHLPIEDNIIIHDSKILKNNE